MAGLWIGKQSQADDHLIVRNISETNGKTLECVVSAHRSIWRRQPKYPNRWDSRELLQLMITWVMMIVTIRRLTKTLQEAWTPTRSIGTQEEEMDDKQCICLRGRWAAA